MPVVPLQCNKKCLQTFEMSPGGQNCPQLRIADLTEGKRRAFYQDSHAFRNVTKLLVNSLPVTWEMCQNLTEEGCTACKNIFSILILYTWITKNYCFCNLKWEFKEIFMCIKSGQRFTKVIKQSSKTVIIGPPFSLTAVSPSQFP